MSKGIKRFFYHEEHEVHEGKTKQFVCLHHALHGNVFLGEQT